MQAFQVSHVISLRSEQPKVLIRPLEIKDLAPEILFPSELARETLPRPHSPLIRGHFLVLDVNLPPTSQEEKTSSRIGGSYIEIGFGDDRKDFAGMHRFEVTRDVDAAEGDDGDITIYFTSLACNPRVDRLLCSRFLFSLHDFYALCLFRDGIAEVLRP
jgi:hypothetical protein